MWSLGAPDGYGTLRGAGVKHEKIFSAGGEWGGRVGNEGLQPLSGAHGVWRTELGGVGITRRSPGHDRALGHFNPGRPPYLITFISSERILFVCVSMQRPSLVISPRAKRERQPFLSMQRPRGEG